LFKLTVKRSFAAAHKLENYKGRCAVLHGHTWTVEVTVCGEHLDDCGMIIDFKVLKDIVDKIIRPFDHSYLNELDVLNASHVQMNPTAENLAYYIYQEMKKVLVSDYPNVKISAVRIWESPEASAIYQED
jgi:6-pyruvoyltetrahydropterin/6-carboxytetrahydropterin synthase